MYDGERFNSYSHLAGALLALAGSIVLVNIGLKTGSPIKIVSYIIYGTSLVLLYGFSTLYHSTQGKTKKIFQRLDHDSIYILIAGTYTPFTLISLGGRLGYALFISLWLLAAVGIFQERLFCNRSRKLSLIIYLFMGWIALTVIFPLIEAISLTGFLWVAAGGIAYTAGIYFYLYDDKYKHWHGIWHLFVIAGSLLHYCAIILYVA